MRKRFLIFAVLAGSLLAPAGAQAGQMGYWKVQATASIRYDWTITSSQACEAVGSGRLSATVVGGRSNRFRMGYFARGGFKSWAIFPHLMKPSGGRITLTDNTTQNPPELPSGTCTPTNKTNCVSRPISRSRTFVDVRGKNARRNVGAVFQVTGIRAAVESLSPRCNDGDFDDWAHFLGSPNNDDFGATLVRMPSASHIGRRAFSVKRTESFFRHEGNTTARTIRRVTLHFTPA